MQHEDSTPDIESIMPVVREEEWVMNTANISVKVKFRYQQVAGTSRETLDSKRHQDRYDTSQKGSPTTDSYQHPRAHSKLTRPPFVSKHAQNDLVGNLQWATFTTQHGRPPNHCRKRDEVVQLRHMK